MGRRRVEMCDSTRVDVYKTGQVYLLTPMDRATLTHAKSTISRCTPSLRSPSVASDILNFKAHCYTDRQLSVISTYVHGEAQTLLGRFVVDILYKLVCTVNFYGISG